MKKQLLDLAAIVLRGLNMIARRHELARARQRGMQVGANTRLVGTQHFGTEPYLVWIGKDCLINDRVSFITHDGGVQVDLIRARVK